MGKIMEPAGHAWIDSWVCTPQPTRPDQLPPAPFRSGDRVLADTTLRQTVRVSVGGARLRVSFSNSYGTAVLRITGVTAASPSPDRLGVGGVRPETVHPVTFGGSGGVDVAPGAEITSDPLELPAAPGSVVTVTAYLPEGLPATGVTSHPGSRTTSYLLRGDHVAAAELPGSTPVEHWYLLSGVRVLAPAGTAVAVAAGDSLTDGRGSTTDHHDRWPDRLFDRLIGRPGAGSGQVAVLSHAAGGTCLLDDGRGPDPVGRLITEALSRSGRRWLMLFKGVNDIGTAPATAPAQERITADLIAGYRRIIGELHRHGVRLYGVTLTPFGGNADYDDPAGHRERTRRAINHWWRTSGAADAVLDFDQVVRDPADPRRLAPAFDVSDHLHLNPTGYRALADAVPLDLFTCSPEYPRSEI